MVVVCEYMDVGGSFYAVLIYIFPVVQPWDKIPANRLNCYFGYYV